MSLSPNEKYPGATEADPNYKDSKFKDNNPSTTNNGSPLKALDRNEQLALQEAMMNAAGFDYNGVVDTPQNSQMFAAYKAALSNGANLLSNHNFIIASPDDSQPAPSATPTSYPPGYQIFSGVFANETTGITNLTYIDGHVSFSGGDFYLPVPNTGGIERLTQFAASVADFDGKPRTRGVSFSLVGDEYRVTVGVDALEDAGSVLTPLGSVKFEQGSVATGHEVKSLFDIYGHPNMGIYDIRAFGAIDGEVSTNAIKSAILEAEKTRGEVTSPGGTFFYDDEIEISSPISFIGNGVNKTTFKPLSSYSGYFLKINDTWRNSNGEDSPDSIKQVSLGNHGVLLSGFSVIGDRDNSARGILFYARNDQVKVEDVRLLYLNGCALNIGSSYGVTENDFGLMRESEFFNVSIHGCGNLTEPCFVISTGNSVSDGTNQLDFHKLQVQYNFGQFLLTSGSSTYSTRRIRFFGFMLHGRYKSLDDSAAHDVMSISGRVEGVSAFGLSGNGSSSDSSGAKYALIRVKTDPTMFDPKRITINGEITNCYGSVYIVNSAGSLHIDGHCAPSGSGHQIEGNELVLSSGALSSGNFQYNVTANENFRSLNIASDQFKYLSESYSSNPAMPLRAESGCLVLGSTDANSPSFYFGSSDNPEGVIDADKGSIYIHTTGLGESSGAWFVKSSSSSNTGWRKMQSVSQSNSSNMSDASNIVNSQAPQAGYMVWNGTLGQPLWKSGDLSSSPWKSADGTSVIIPS